MYTTKGKGRKEENQMKTTIIDTKDALLEELEFTTYQEAEDYVYGKYNYCWNIEKNNDGSYTFIVYAA
jgi:hypothetical protein